MPIFGVPERPDGTAGSSDQAIPTTEIRDVGIEDLEAFFDKDSPYALGPTDTGMDDNPSGGAGGLSFGSEEESGVDPEDLAHLVKAAQDVLVSSGQVEQLTLSDDLAVHAEQRRMVADLVQRVLPDNFPVLRYSPAQKDRAVAAAVDSICGYGAIQNLLNDGDITEVIVRGTQPVLVERAGVLTVTDVRFHSLDQLLVIMRRIAREVGRELNEGHPILNGWLKDGSRVNCVIAPLTKEGGILTIRKFSPVHFRLADLVRMGSLPAEAAEWLKELVRAKVNIVVSGGTGSGKTAMVRALAYEIPEHEYLITIEDTWELRLSNSRDRVTTLVKREAAAGMDEGEVSLRDLVINALRMRPDRIIVGEVRGAECFDMLQAFSTGHEGALTTVHANNVQTAIVARVPMLAKLTEGVDVDTAREQTVFAIEAVVQVSRTPEGRRIVREISTVDPDPKDWKTAVIAPVWRRLKRDGELVRVGEPGPRVTEKLEECGLGPPGRAVDDESADAGAEISGVIGGRS